MINLDFMISLGFNDRFGFFVIDLEKLFFVAYTGIGF